MTARAWLLLVAMLLFVGCVEEGGEDKNEPPVARLSIGENVVNIGETVEFDGSGSYDDNRIVKYMFWFDDGRASGETISPIVEHAYAEKGNKTITLAVWDDKGLIGLDTHSIYVNAPPEAQMAITSNGVPTTDGWVGEPLTFSATDSTDTDGYIRHFMWDFGDGTNSSLEDDTHVYEGNGTYTVELTVEDDYGATDVATATMNVRMHRFMATWNHTQELQLMSENGYLSDADPTANYTIDVDWVNITRVWFNLTWTDDEIIISDPDAFLLEVEPFFGDAKQLEEDDGHIELEWIMDFDGESYPTARHIYAPNIEDARNIANHRNRTTLQATGGYEISITITVNQVIIDPGNYYHFEMWIERYYGEAWVDQLE